MTLSLPLTLADRFAFILRALHAAVAARIRFPPVTAEIIVFICNRLKRIGRDFERLARQIRAGTYVARRRARRAAGGTGSRRGVSVVMLHWTLGLPPWHPGWLHRIAPGDAGVWAGALRQLLAEPEMAAVMAAVPRMGRILRPLCFMLKVEMPPPRPLAPPPIADGAAGEPCVSPNARVAAPRSAPPADPAAPPVVARCDTEPAGEIFRPA